MHARSSLVIVTALLGGAPSTSYVAAQDERAWVRTVREIVERDATSQGIPSFATVVVDRRNSIAEVCYGRWGSDATSPVTPATLYRTGSVGKTLTDLAVLIAAEQGRLNLNIDMRNYIPFFQPFNPLAICRKDGALHAVIEWFFIYPLEELAEGRFAFPSCALYGHEVLWFIGEDEHPDAALLGVGATRERFQRR